MDDVKIQKEKGGLLQIGSTRWVAHFGTPAIQGAQGSVSYSDLQLTVEKGLIPPVRLTTFLHELVHVWTGHLSKSMSAKVWEQLADDLADRMFDFMARNPQTARDLIQASSAAYRYNPKPPNPGDKPVLEETG